jgi:recombination protein RecT
VEQQEGQQLSIKDEIEKLKPRFQETLPRHVSCDRFTRVVLTAVASDPDLARADRRSLFEAALKCAADGLLPDRTQAAFVLFNENIAKNGEPAKWIKRVVYIRMYQGILKLVRNSGQLESISSRIVFENDLFEYRLGDDERIEHTPLLRGMRGQPIGLLLHCEAGKRRDLQGIHERGRDPRCEEL